MTDLLRATAALVEVASVSRSEAALAAVVEEQLRACGELHVQRIGDSVVARTDAGRSRRVLLAGHLDTVPPFGEIKATVEGDTVHGLGAVDMKGGLAVMLSLAGEVHRATCDVTLVFYACEEVERDANALSQIATTHRALLDADAAILGEPTGGVVEAGCQGTMRASLTMRGVRAHSARPFTGVNAVHRLRAALDVLVGYRSREVALDGCTYAEQLQAVRVAGGVAGNVVPDEATLVVNYRFAPDRDARAAEVELRRLFEGAVDPGIDSLDIVDVAQGAAPSLSHPVLEALVRAAGAPARAKVGWTDVATMAAMGVPAANFGPGDPLLAHTPDEHVTRDELEHCRSVLADVLGL
ncbi:MAG: succinyl-diaminopimelate desuccinylase [Acidimicrobiales bacterium]